MVETTPSCRVPQPTSSGPSNQLVSTTNCPHFVFHRHLRLPPTPVSVGLLHQTTSCAAWLSAADRDWDEKGSREPEIGGGKPVSHNKLRCNFARVCSFSLGPSAATEVFASEHSETWKPMSMQGAGGKRAPPVNTRKNWNEKRGSARSSARRARASHVHYSTLLRT